MTQMISYETFALQCSIKRGQAVSFLTDNLRLNIQDTATFLFEVVKEYNDEFALTGSSKRITKSDQNTIWSCPQSMELQPGIYILKSLKFFKDMPDKQDGLFELTMHDFGICLFEIREDNENSCSFDKLIAKYQDVINNRNTALNAGFGLKTNNEIPRYKCFIFVKNCYLSKKIIVGAYEIIPFIGLGCKDELEIVNDFFDSTFRKGSFETQEEEVFIKNARTGQPTIVIHYPKIYAKSVEEAGFIAKSEAKRIGDLLSIHRYSYHEIFAEVVTDLISGHSFYSVVTPSYHGNLIRGEIGGEIPSLIIKRLDKTRNNPLIQLYLELYKEAVKEEKSEFAYFRFWNLLETIARNKNFVGQPRKDWSGNIEYNRKHHVKIIQDQAEQLVKELLRQAINKKGLTITCFDNGINQGDIDQLIPIWYRHRNCMGHRGGCFPNNITFCLPNDPKYINCKNAYDEMIFQNRLVDRYNDKYLWSLSEVAKIVIEVELD